MIGGTAAIKEDSPLQKMAAEAPFVYRKRTIPLPVATTRRRLAPRDAQISIPQKYRGIIAVRIIIVMIITVLGATFPIKLIGTVQHYHNTMESG